MGGLRFTAVAGMQRAKEALLLLAVDPSLKGVLIAGGPGTGKSVLARAFGRLMGGCCELPPSITEDRLLGGLNLERVLLTGERRADPGLLSRADGGLLYCDNVHLLNAGVAAQIAGALERAAIRLERDGVSEELSARFVFVGSYDPGAGGVSRSLADCAALHVSEAGTHSAEERLAVLRSNLEEGEDREREERLRALIEEARERLREVEIGPAGERRLIETAQKLAVCGHRGDIYARRAARASAALHARKQVQEEDLEAAVRLVLTPRAVSPPVQRPSPEDAAAQKADSRGDGADEVEVQTVRCEAPAQVFARRPARQAERGRYVRATADAPPQGRIALEATVRAAVLAGRRGPGGRLRVTAEDLRYKRFKRKAGMLVLFVVDASGSMALHRLNEAKGAIVQLLQEAYVHRDRVALVAFRGHDASVLLPPTRSVQAARRMVDAMPAGGATPLAAGLAAALEVARGAEDTLLVLLTDGRANVARAEEVAVRQDLEGVCFAVRSAGIAAVVIDTANGFVSAGEAERLASMLGARYAALPRANARAIVERVNAETAAARRRATKAV
jgi:magnesium chelatase subunit D